MTRWAIGSSIARFRHPVSLRATAKQLLELILLAHSTHSGTVQAAIQIHREGDKNPSIFYTLGVAVSKLNPRYANANLRRKHRARFKAMGAECGICHGRLGPIHYDEPSDAEHPLSFVIDEIRPVSKWKLFGYPSPQAAAQDWTNLQAAHRCCNAMKGAKVDYQFPTNVQRKCIVIDGNW